MRILFYAPFKPLDHPHPSGDLVIGNGLVNYLTAAGHEVQTASRLRARWIYRQPWRWPGLLAEISRVSREIGRARPDLWLTYHSYYKAPDIIGPAVCRRHRLPYYIFQGIFSTKRRRSWRTIPGYWLNKKALCSAAHVFTNRQEDFLNLQRLLPPSRTSFIAPGIYPEQFVFDAQARAELRQSWQADGRAVILTAAMFRPDVKSEGLSWVIRACGALARQGRRLLLVIAGDGKERQRLEELAASELPDQVHFAGMIDRPAMYQLYSAADLFVFPGIRESLGMVFLEAQSCGLPVVAFRNGGIPEVVRDGETGILTEPFALDAFIAAMKGLLTDKERRRRMGQAAAATIRAAHDLGRNYRQVEEVLCQPRS